MRILVVGGGGREHALVWTLARFHKELFCAPGNAGIAELAECVAIEPGDIPRLAEFARKQRIDLTVVGPEAPLVAGLADEFQRQGLAVFGPTRAGAQLEGDKAFAKRLMQELGIPTARFEVFDDVAKARRFLARQPERVVIKAAGLAAGKGVVVAQTRDEAEAALNRFMVEGQLGPAGRSVVIEECLEGEEASIIGLCDGQTVRFLRPSQDHKRLLDNDQGPNTGGMGAYAPAPVVTPDVERRVEEWVFRPLLAGLRDKGIDYRGVIYAGMMLTEQGPYVLEFNCRFGDPETQVILPLLEGDLAELLMACVLGRLAERAVRCSDEWALCVVAAAEGYPGAYRQGMVISGLEGVGEEVIVFHAGTRRVAGQVVTNGGRVLGVTGRGKTLQEARDRAYQALKGISFEGMRFRSDIGVRGLTRLNS